MADEIKEYAGGWITERKGTDVPVFLKFAFVVIGLGGVAYLAMFMNGEVDHADRGVLVRAFNAATEASDPLMWMVAAAVVIFVVILAKFTFTEFHEDDKES